MAKSFEAEEGLEVIDLHNHEIGSHECMLTKESVHKDVIG